MGGAISLRRPARCALVPLLLAAFGACGSPAATPPARDVTAREPALPSALAWDYEVTVEPSLDLDVRATFHGANRGTLRVDDATGKFVEGLAMSDGAAWTKATLGERGWSTRCASSCTVRYRFRLRDAAKEANDLDVALASGGAVFAPPSTWLVRPSDVPPGRYRLQVKTPASPSAVRFATGVRAASPSPRAGDGATFEASAASLEESAFAAFGALRTGHVADPGLEYALAPELGLSDETVARWLRAETGAIAGYFGRTPDGYGTIFVAPGSSATTTGKTLGGGGASLVVRLGQGISARDVMDDWVVAHELIHVAFPDLDRRHTWFSEGLATYVEPIARQRAGLITRERVWADMVEGLPQGQPGASDGGLDGSSEWGRVYWGGATYFFLADVRIRERTGGARGLEDALRAVVATGANVEAMLPIARILELGDAATGTHVMRELYDELGTARGGVDLAALWKRLGVRGAGKQVSFDDAAPLASVRDAILPRR